MYQWTAAQDWSAYDGIDFRIAGGNTGGTISVLLRDNFANGQYEQFRYTFADDFTGWRHMTVPFTSFVRSPNQPVGTPDDGLTLTSVHSLALQTMLAPGAGPLTASLNIDEIVLSNAASAPIAPSGLLATAESSTEITVAWSDNSNNETGFEIERRRGSSPSWMVVAQLAADVTQWLDTALASNETYTYRVRATNAAGGSAWSSEAGATTLPVPPAAPTGLSATTTANGIDLTWSDNSDNETLFRIERSEDGVTFYPSTTRSADTTSYQYNPGSSGEHSYFRVRAENAGGFSEWSNVDDATTVPGAPGNIIATPVRGTEVNLSWPGVEGEDGYVIETSTDGGVTYSPKATVAPNPGGSTPTAGYSLIGLNPDTAYHVRIAATQSGFSSPWKTATFTTPKDHATLQWSNGTGTFYKGNDQTTLTIAELPGHLGSKLRLSFTVNMIGTWDGDQVSYNGENPIGKDYWKLTGTVPSTTTGSIYVDHTFTNWTTAPHNFTQTYPEAGGTGGQTKSYEMSFDFYRQPGMPISFTFSSNTTVSPGYLPEQDEGWSLSNVAITEAPKAAIWIEATKSDALESADNEARKLKFKVKRDPNGPGTGVPLDIHLHTPGGTAEVNSDYEWPPYMVTIPSSSDEVEFEVLAVDDSVVERTETFVAHLKAAESYFLAGNVHAGGEINDNDNKIRRASVDFDGQDVKRDTGQVFDGPEWGDINGDGIINDPKDIVNPVSFVRSTPGKESKVGVTVRFDLFEALPAGAYTISGTATGIGELTFSGQVNLVGEVTGFEATLTSQEALSDKIQAMTMSTEWEVKRGAETVFTYSTEGNPTYVTRDDATGAFASVLDVAGAARGKSDEIDQIVTAIWSEFSDRTVRRVPARAWSGLQGRAEKQLTYAKTALGEAVSENSTLEEMLKAPSADGDCFAWSEFLIAAIKVHGIGSEKIELRSAYESPGEGIGFGPATMLLGNYNWDPNPGGNDENGWIYRLAQDEYSLDTPYAAQGNDHPPSRFKVHMVVRVDGKVYDPSFGGSVQPSLIAWEDARVSGFEATFEDAQNNSIVLARKNIGDQEVQPTVTVINA